MRVLVLTEVGECVAVGMVVAAAVTVGTTRAACASGSVIAGRSSGAPAVSVAALTTTAVPNAAVRAALRMTARPAITQASGARTPQSPTTAHDQDARCARFIDMGSLTKRAAGKVQWLPWR